MSAVTSARTALSAFFISWNDRQYPTGFGLHFRNRGGRYARSVSDQDGDPKSVLFRICGVDAPDYAAGKSEATPAATSC